MDQVSRDHIKQIYAIFAHRPALWTALRAISAAPHVVLRVTTPFVGVGEAKNIEASSLALSATQSGALSYTDRMRHFTCKGEKWRFLNVYDRCVERNDDIPANRFVVHFIRYSTRLLKDCARQVVTDEILCEYEARFRRLAARIHAIGSALSPHLQTATLSRLPLDDQILQFHPHYRVVLDAYLACESIG